LRHLEGKAAPAATDLSPVTRDYPSRARVGLFQAAALRLTPSASEKFRSSFRKLLSRVCPRRCLRTLANPTLYNFLIETRSFPSPVMRWRLPAVTHGASSFEEHPTSRTKSTDAFPDQRS
jgi:hypothetical protein